MLKLWATVGDIILKGTAAVGRAGDAILFSDSAILNLDTARIMETGSADATTPEKGADASTIDEVAAELLDDANTPEKGADASTMDEDAAVLLDGKKKGGSRVMSFEGAISVGVDKTEAFHVDEDDVETGQL